jgi:hypothetical protein
VIEYRSVLIGAMRCGRTRRTSFAEKIKGSLVARLFGAVFPVALRLALGWLDAALTLRLRASPGFAGSADRFVLREICGLLSRPWHRLARQLPDMVR